MLIIYSIIIIFVAYYLNYLKRKYSYWKIKGVKGPVPVPIVGNFGSVIHMKKSLSDVLQEAYERYPNEKIVGLYRGFAPVLVIRDIDLIKNITIKYFNMFCDRGKVKEEDELSKNLFEVQGNTWRILRKKINPVFTLSKIRNLMPLIQESADKLTNYTKYLVQEGIDEEIKILTSKYTLDVIGSCAFGIDVHAYSQKGAVFRDMGRKLLNPPIALKLQRLIEFLFPGYTSILNMFHITDVYNFFINIVNKVIEEREGKPKARKDFMDLLIELKEEGRASRRDDNNKIETIEIDNSVIVSQAVLFYAAGYESSAGVMSYLFYELASHQDIQDKLYQEVSDIYHKYNKTFTYESFKEMTYFQMVLNEILRKYPVGGWILRRATEDYVIPESNLVIDEGTFIYLSIAGLHADQKYFNYPNEFNPENFSPENIKNIPQCAFLPFGIGPRRCIGIRFAELEIMFGAATFLKDFKLEKSLKTKTKLTYNPTLITLTPIDGLWLKILKR